MQQILGTNAEPNFCPKTVTETHQDRSLAPWLWKRDNRDSSDFSGDPFYWNLAGSGDNLRVLLSSSEQELTA